MVCAPPPVVSPMMTTPLSFRMTGTRLPHEYAAVVVMIPNLKSYCF